MKTIKGLRSLASELKMAYLVGNRYFNKHYNKIYHAYISHGIGFLYYYNINLVQIINTKIYINTSKVDFIPHLKRVIYTLVKTFPNATIADY